MPVTQKLLSGIAAVGVIYLTALPLAAADARFASLKGTVQIFEKQKWVNVNLQTKIPSGTLIQTGYRSQAVIMYATGGQMALAQNTRVTVLDTPSTSGTNREIILDHGQVSAFVRKGDQGAPNKFQMRTPTQVAGVRGSMIAGMLAGKTLTVEAIQSAAQIAQVSANSNVQSAGAALAQARNNLAQAQASANRTNSVIARLEIAAQQTRSSSNPNDRIAAKMFAEKLTTLKAEQVQQGEAVKTLAAQESAATTQLATANNQVAAIAKEEAALTKIAQGDQAKANGAAITKPTAVQSASTRPAQSTTLGQTATEQVFTANTDVKVGLGNDTQTLYNSVNTVTQPTTTGLPTLKKF